MEGGVLLWVQHRWGHTNLCYMVSTGWRMGRFLRVQHRWGHIHLCYMVSTGWRVEVLLWVQHRWGHTHLCYMVSTGWRVGCSSEYNIDEATPIFVTWWVQGGGWGMLVWVQHRWGHILSLLHGEYRVEGGVLLWVQHRRGHIHLCYMVSTEWRVGPSSEYNINEATPIFVT